MAGKNDVEIMIRSKDASGPGIDSAKARLNALRMDTQKLGDALRGAGAAGAIEFFGRAANATMGRLLEVQKELIAGQLTMNEAIEEAGLRFAKNLPLIGQAFSAGQQIRNFLDGSGEAQARADMADQRHNALQNSQRNDANAFRGLNAGLDPFRTELRTLGTEGPERERLQALIASEADQRKIANMEAMRAELMKSSDRNIREQAEALGVALDTASQTVQTRLKLAIEKIDDAEIIERLKKVAETNRENLGTFRERAAAMAGVDASTDARARLQGFFEQRGMLQAGSETESLDKLRELAGQFGQASGPASLASGEQQRFTTGLRESSEATLKRESIESNRLLKEQNELLKKLLAAAEKGNEENPADVSLNLGIFSQ